MARRKSKFSFGPGFLVTAAFIGPGTVTSCSLAGASFGYSLLYALVFATVTTLILQEMTGRLSLGSGYDLSQALREFPQNTLTRLVFMVLTLAAITFGCAAYEAGNITGGSLGLEIITHIPHRIWAIVISILAILILGRKQYRLVEKTLIVLVFLMSLSFIATFIIIKPDVLSMLKGMIPTLPDESLLYVLALVGTTVVPYNLFLHSSAVKKKWQSYSQMNEVKKDLILSIALGGVISATIVVTSAVAFFKQGLQVNQGIQLAQQLKPLFGGGAHLLFGIGFFAAGLSSAITAPYAAAFAASGVLGWEKGSDSKNFQVVWLVVILIGVCVSIIGISPLSVIIFAQVANGLILPVASVFLLIVLNNKQKMGPLANNWKQNVLGILIILVVSFLGIWNIIKIFLSQ